MRTAITLILSLGWIVLGYFGLKRIANRFFGGRYRAETVAAAVVLAFTIGSNWPHAMASDSVPVAAAMPAAAVPAPVDVGAACAAARLTTVVGKGNADLVSVRRGTSEVPAQPDIQLQREDTLITGGWAARTDLKGPVSAVCIAVDGHIVPGVKILYGLNRPDVAAAFHNDALALTGYAISLPATLIDSGSHTVQDVAVEADGSAALLPGLARVHGPGRSKR